MLKLSIITAVYNGEKTIENTIESVRSQTHPLVEHILQDGGSTDRTLKIVEDNKWPSLFAVSEPDSGIYDALNKGISRATGDVIGFLHSDDFFSNENVLAEIAKALEITGADGIFGNLVYVHRNNTKRVIRNWKPGAFTSGSLSLGWMPPHPTVFLRKEVYQRIGLYDTAFKISSDYDKILRLFSDSEIKMHYLPLLITNMRVGGVSNASLRQIMNKMREDYHIIKKNSVGGLFTLFSKNVRKLGQFFR